MLGMHNQEALDMDLTSSTNESSKKTELFETKKINKYGFEVKYIEGEFWTSKQRQASSLHEISYRACFKPQLPDYFIQKFTNAGDLVYDPFGGRGTTALQAALHGRKIIQNDINPLSIILTKPRLIPPSIDQIDKRLRSIDLDMKSTAVDLDLKMFFEEKTLNEIINLRNYFIDKNLSKSGDNIDEWIQMVATNRLTGHSSGFFSVYTFPPNQAVSQKAQIRINEKRKQKPQYRDTKSIILKKSKSLLRNINSLEHRNLLNASKEAIFLTKPANETSEIKDNSVNLVVTSPPFLDIVQYAQDNWLRCWFNNFNAEEIGSNITIPKDLESWNLVMEKVLEELFRVLTSGGKVAFEVGEIRKNTIKLDEEIVPIAAKVGFKIDYVMINSQDFTKTSNIWGVSNNDSGTNTNRIIVLSKSL
jgi:DNA modification methylase